MLAVHSPTVSARRGPIGPRLVTFAEGWFDIPEGSIQNPKRRNGKISQARFAIAYVLAETAGWSQPRISELFKQSDHTSVNNGLKRAQALLRTDAAFFDAVERLQKEIAPE